MANIILWRHADAEVISSSGADIDRALTKRGRKDAQRMASWLNDCLPEGTIILCSPAKRCLETLAALNDVNVSANKYKIQVVELLGLDALPERILQSISNTDTEQTYLLVGHQPNIGFVIAELIGMQEKSCVVKKGSVWWIRQRFLNGVARKISHEYYLYTVQQP